LSYLARREHSRTELRRKLAPHAESAEQLDRLLDELETKKLLSDERFVEVLKRSRGERFGTARIKQELKAHQLGDALVRSAVDELRQTELARARAVWQRRFGAPATDAAERARQMRFLAQRGFSTEVIYKVVRGVDED
jgi:regulatory protein